MTSTLLFLNKGKWMVGGCNLVFFATYEFIKILEIVVFSKAICPKWTGLSKVLVWNAATIKISLFRQVNLFSMSLSGGDGKFMKWNNVLNCLLKTLGTFLLHLTFASGRATKMYLPTSCTFQRSHFISP